MAIGRISGPLLKENLLRDGVNLRFESNLIYLDVNTHADDVSTNPADPSLWTGRVGIRNSNPAYPLDVTGTARATTILGGELDIDEIYINDNSISSQLGDLVLSAATSLDKVTINSNVLVNGNLHATGSITADGSLQLGNDDTDNVVFAADIDSNFMPNITDTYIIGGTSKRWLNGNFKFLEIGDIDFSDNTIASSITNGDLNLNGNGTGSVIINNALTVSSSGSMAMPGNFSVGGDLTVTGDIIGGPLRTDDIHIVGNRIETTASNSNLELNTVGTGSIELLANSNVTGTFDVSGQSTLASINVEDLTSGRVVLAGTSGELEDSANLTFNGTTLTVTGDQTVTGTATLGNLVVNGTSLLTGIVTASEDLTVGRTLYVTGDIVGGPLRTDDIQIVGNRIETTASNSNLELNTVGTGSIELQTNTNVIGTLDVSGQTTLASVNVEDLTSGRIVLAGTSGELEDSANLTFDGTTLTVVDTISSTTGNFTTVNTTTITTTGTATTNNLVVNGVSTLTGTVTTSSDVNIFGTLTVTGDIVGGPLRTDDIQIVGNRIETTSSNSNFEVNTVGTGSIELLANSNVTGTFGVSELSTLAQVQVSDLTSGRLTFASASGRLVDSANLTFNGTTLTVTGDQTVTGTITTNNLTVNDNAIVTGTLTVTGDIVGGPLRTDDIQIVGNKVETTQSNSDLELDAAGTGTIELLTNTNITGTVDVSGQATLASANIEDLTDGRVVLAGVNGELEDNANLTFDGTLLTVTGNQQITGDLTVDGNITLGGNIRIGDQDLDTITVVADFTSDLIPDASNTYDLGSSLKQWRVVNAAEFDNGVININDNVITTTVSNADLELRASGTGQILIPNNNVTISNSLTVDGETFLDSIVIDNDLTVKGTLLTHGNNVLTGETFVTGNLHIHNTVISSDTDYVTFTTGLAPISAIYLTKYVSVDPIAWFAIQEGSAWTIPQNAITPEMLAYGHFGPGTLNLQVGDNVLSVQNITLSANTTYTMWIQQTGSNLTEYIFSTDPNYTATDIPADYSSTTSSPTILQFQSTRVSIEGDLIVTNDITTSAVQTDDVRIDGNVITTTQSNSNLELRANGSGTIKLQENTNVTGTFDVSSQSTLASVNVEDLTSGRVVLAGTGGELEDSANLTFNGSELTVTGDQTVTGTVDVNTEINTPVGNITTVNTGLINVDSITINDNTIRTTVSNADLELTPSGTGIVYISGTGAVRIPAGNTAERPPTGESGFIRYNSQTNNIEAWNGVVFAGISGGGSSSDANGDTRLTFETSGNNEDVIRFFAGVAGLTPGSTIGSNEIMTVSNEGVVISGTIRIQNNVIENINSNEDLIIRASGAGRVILDGSGEPGATGNVFATDPLLSLNTSQTGSNSYDSGLIIERGIEINTGFIWDESADEFAAISTIEQGTVRGNVAITGYQNVSVASVKLNSETINKVTFTDANKIVRSLDTGRSADVGGVMKFTAGSELAIPSGTTAQRPASPQTASVRYNSDLDYFEGYAGSSWQGLGIGFGTAPSYQGIVANGTDFEFTLDLAPLSAAGIIVTINGVVQEPEYAYEVEDNVLRFIDESSTVITPDLGDRIDVRFLSKPAISSVRERSFLGDGSTRTFGMSLPIASKAEVLVFVNNIYQDVEVYSVSGKNVIFVQAPQSDDRINIVHIAGIVAPNVATIQEADDSAIAFAIALG